MEDRKEEIYRVALSSKSPFGRLESNFVGNYYPYLSRSNEKFYARLVYSLKDDVLIDIGAGKDASDMAKFARSLGVSQFIAVDREVVPYLENQNTQMGIREDALFFLADQKDHSASITLNGMDDVFLTMPIRNQQLLLEEIGRVASGHVVFGINSTEFLEKLTVFGFQKEDFGHAKLYKKG